MVSKLIGKGPHADPEYANKNFPGYVGVLQRSVDTGTCIFCHDPDCPEGECVYTKPEQPVQAFSRSWVAFQHAYKPGVEASRRMLLVLRDHEIHYSDLSTRQIGDVFALANIATGDGWRVMYSRFGGLKEIVENGKKVTVNPSGWTVGHLHFQTYNAPDVVFGCGIYPDEEVASELPEYPLFVTEDATGEMNRAPIYGHTVYEMPRWHPGVDRHFMIDDCKIEGTPEQRLEFLNLLQDGLGEMVPNGGMLAILRGKDPAGANLYRAHVLGISDLGRDFALFHAHTNFQR